MYAQLMSACCLRIAVLPLVLVFSQDSAEARTWSSKHGNYEIEAEAVSFNEDLVVLKKLNGDLVAVELAELSDADREFVLSKEAKDAERKSAQELQTWTAKDGMKVRGRVVAYGRKEVVVQRKLGKVNIDNVKFSQIDPLHQRLILKIVSELEKTMLEDEKQLEEWAKSLGGAPKSYKLEGVLLQLESGEEIGVPFFLFSKEDLAVLEPGWELWLERNESDESREKESFLMRSQAMAYQRDRAATQQIEMLKLGLLAAATGIVQIYQVGLAPGPGVYGRPMAVMVPAQTSQAATIMALRSHPGYVLVAVRRASR